MDEPAAGPPTHSRAHHADSSPATASDRHWPVLARIADVSRSEPLVSIDPRATQPSYRVDSAHEYAAAQDVAAAKEYAPSLSPALPKPPAATPRRPGSKRPATSEEPQTTRPLDNAPMPIKLTVGAWKKVEPHRELIRFTALATLIVVAGMSVVLSMGSQPDQVETPHAATTTAAAPSLSTETSTQSVEVDHGLTPMIVPEEDTTSTAPTATGPLAPASQALVSAESTTSPATKSETGESKTSDAPAVSHAYPTTPFAEAKLPQLGDQGLPRVQTREPAVAELRGVVIETQTR